ncbi:biotin/lipoyl-containing protein [Phycisphaerales bacterium ac7]
MAGHVSSDPNVFILPDLGEGVHEAELISWKVKPGDHVEEHDIVAEMETDKALVEVPSPRAGVIKELFGEVGEILKVGNPAWTYEGAGDDAGSTPSPVESGTAQAEQAEVAGEEEREDDGTVVGTMSGSLGAVSTRRARPSRPQRFVASLATSA